MKNELETIILLNMTKIQGKFNIKTRINTIEPTKINLDYKNYLENDM